MATISYDRLSRQIFLFTTTAIASGFAIPVAAQTAIIPPTVSNIDQNGVELATGKLRLNVNDGEIGKGPGSIALSRTYGAPYGSSDASGIDDNWKAVLYKRTESTGNVVYVVLQNTSVIFDQTSGGYTPRASDGSTLTANSSGYHFIYTDRDGVVR